jgi:tetratricopeptide (TPR) repeat protein
MSYCGLGTCQIKIGKFQKAVGFYQKALDLDKNCPYAYTGLGVIYQNTKMYKESIYNINKSIKIDP